MFLSQQMFSLASNHCVMIRVFVFTGALSHLCEDRGKHQLGKSVERRRHVNTACSQTLITL